MRLRIRQRIGRFEFGSAVAAGLLLATAVVGQYPSAAGIPQSVATPPRALVANRDTQHEALGTVLTETPKHDSLGGAAEAISSIYRTLVPNPQLRLHHRVRAPGTDDSCRLLVRGLLNSDSVGEAVLVRLLEDDSVTVPDRIRIVAALECHEDHTAVAAVLMHLLVTPPDFVIESRTESPIVRLGPTITEEFPIYEGFNRLVGMTRYISNSEWRITENYRTENGRLVLTRADTWMEPAQTHVSVSRYYQCPVREAAAAAIWRVAPGLGFAAFSLISALAERGALPIDPDYAQYAHKILSGGANGRRRELVVQCSSASKSYGRFETALILCQVIGIRASDPDASPVVQTLIEFLGDARDGARASARGELVKLAGTDHGGVAAWTDWWLSFRVGGETAEGDSDLSPAEESAPVNPATEPDPSVTARASCLYLGAATYERSSLRDVLRGGDVRIIIPGVSLGIGTGLFAYHRTYERYHYFLGSYPEPESAGFQLLSFFPAFLDLMLIGAGRRAGTGFVPNVTIELAYSQWALIEGVSTGIFGKSRILDIGVIASPGAALALRGGFRELYNPAHDDYIAHLPERRLRYLYAGAEVGLSAWLGKGMSQRSLVPMVWDMAVARPRQRAMWSRVKRLNTIGGYRSFLGRYRHGKLAEDVRERLDRLRFEQAMADTATATCESYLADARDPYRRVSIEKRLDSLRFARARRGHSLQSYENYRRLSPPWSPFLTTAEAAVDSLRFQDARVANTEAAYREYLSSSSSPVFAGEASRLLEAQVWLQAGRSQSESAYESYVDEFPAGRHFQEASDWLRLLVQNSR